MCFLLKTGDGWGSHVYTGAEAAFFRLVMAQVVPSIALTSLITYVILRYSVPFQKSLPNMP